MTQEQLQHAAQMLVVNSRELMGGDEPKMLPKLFVVNGKGYWFLNVARRAAIGTDYSIEVLTIEEAWNIHMHLPADSLKKDAVDWDFDQTGSTFNGYLFDRGSTVFAGMVPNPVIKAQSGKCDPMEVLDREINQLFLSVRAQNVLTRQGIKTYGELLKFGREPLLKLRNMGLTTISVFDAEMERVGLWNQWKYNQPVKQ